MCGLTEHHFEIAVIDLGYCKKCLCSYILSRDENGLLYWRSIEYAIEKG